MKKFILILLIGLNFHHNTLAATVGVDIPFESTDVGLTEFKPIDTSTGAREDGSAIINNTILEVITWFRNILGFIASTWIVWQGYRMLSSQGDDTQFQNAQNSIIWGVTGLLMSFLIEPFIRGVIYGGSDLSQNLAPGEAIFKPEIATKKGREEIYAFMHWGKMFVGIVSVGMIIFTGIRAMIAMDKDDEISNQRKNLQWILIGIFIIIINEIIVFYGLGFQEDTLKIDQKTGIVSLIRDPARLINELSGFASYLLMFFALSAVILIMYGGFLIITASVDEQQAENGKKIIINVIIGILIAFVSYTLIATMINMGRVF